MPLCDGCDENVLLLGEYQQGRRVVRWCQVCVDERRERGDTVTPATRAWTPADFAPRDGIPMWTRWMALLLVVAFVIALVMGL